MGEAAVQFEPGMLVRAWVDDDKFRICFVLDDSMRDLYGLILADIATGSRHTTTEFLRVETIGRAGYLFREGP